MPVRQPPYVQPYLSLERLIAALLDYVAVCGLPRPLKNLPSSSQPVPSLPPTCLPSCVDPEYPHHLVGLSRYWRLKLLFYCYDLGETRELP